MLETGIIIFLIVFIFIWILLCIKTGVGNIGKIISVVMLLGVVMLIKVSIPPLQPEQYHSEYTTDSQSGFTENKERNRKEGILYTIDDTEKVTRTSHDGEICVKTPQGNGLSARWTEGPVGYERCHMTNENYDFMDYELIAAWNQKDAEKEIMEDFERHYNRDNVLGEIYHMTVDGIEVYYRPWYLVVI